MMTQYEDRVIKRAKEIAAEEWAKGVEHIHSHRLNSFLIFLLQLNQECQPVQQGIDRRKAKLLHSKLFDHVDSY